MICRCSPQCCYGGADGRDHVAQESDVEEKVMDMYEQRVTRYDLVRCHVVRICTYSEHDEDSLQSKTAQAENTARDNPAIYGA